MAITPELLAKLPPPAARPVDFVKDIKPLFEASCIQCHAKGKTKGGLSLETRELLLKGGDSRPGGRARQERREPASCTSSRPSTRTT